MATIRNPIEWGADQLAHAARHAESTGQSIKGHAARPEIRRLVIADLREALSKGFEDFAACRTDVIFLCLIYPAAGLALARFAFDYALLPLLFPLASGFVLIGPVAAVGLYQMSRRREKGATVSWADAFDTVRSPAFGTIALLGLGLLMIFALWLLVAQIVYDSTLGPEPPASLAAFLTDVFTTGPGWAMILAGMGLGFLFAVLVLSISVVSFPLLLDRDVGLVMAVLTSLRAVWTNPLPMAAWGLIVAGGLLLGTIPLFLGLIVVMPVLGHATWHLYRKTVV